MSDEDALRELREAAGGDRLTVLLYYIYFPTKVAAEVAASSLKKNGFSSEVRRGADGINWLVLARHEVVPTADLLRQSRSLLEQLASAGDGEYDGWEAEVR